MRPFDYMPLAAACQGGRAGSAYRQRVRFHRLVVGVEGGTEGEQRGNAANHLGDVAHFFQFERALELFDVAVVEPLLNDGVAADGEGPDLQRDVLPEGDVVPPEAGGTGVWTIGDSWLVATDAVVPNRDAGRRQQAGRR